MVAAPGGVYLNCCWCPCIAGDDMEPVAAEEEEGVGWG